MNTDKLTELRDAWRTVPAGNVTPRALINLVDALLEPDAPAEPAWTPKVGAADEPAQAEPCDRQAVLNETADMLERMASPSTRHVVTIKDIAASLRAGVIPELRDPAKDRRKGERC